MMTAGPVDKSVYRGWFAIGFSHELPVKKILRKTFMGKELVLYRTASGKLVALDAYCPHMGAHFGYGGVVKEEVLQCPFHGLCFAADGHCVTSQYTDAKTDSWPMQESDGVMFIYQKNEPNEVPPPLPCLFQGEGWSEPKFYILENLKMSIKDILENSFDLPHFVLVHGFKKLKLSHEIEQKEDLLKVYYTGTRELLLVPGLTKKAELFDIVIELKGAGHIITTTRPSSGIRICVNTFPTITEFGLIDYRFSARVDIRTINKSFFFLKLIPKKFLAFILTTIAIRMSRKVFGEDIPILENKRYLNDPVTSAKDGPILQCREWIKRFLVPENV